MSCLEDPVTTVVRLLRSNMYVVKDDGSLANICFSGGWYDREFFKNYDGQVTVCLAESSDQKLSLSGKLRRRSTGLRASVWAVDKADGDAGHIMREKLLEEVNRVVRVNRNEPNRLQYTFQDISHASVTHKAYSAAAIGELSLGDALWSEITDANYAKIGASDNVRFEHSTIVNGNYPLMLFRFKIADLKEALVKKFVLGFEGYGVGWSSGMHYGVTVKVWNHVAGAWQNAQTGTSSSDETISIAVSSNVPDFVDDEGYVWFLARTTYPSDAASWAFLYCDYVFCTIYSKGITYLDISTYRDADKVEVRPFIFCTEFSLKAWLLEDLGV